MTEDAPGSPPGAPGTEAAPPAPPTGPAPPAPRRRRDRWAHRRVEPRALALMWAVYLFCAAWASIIRAGSPIGLPVEAAREPARMMLVMIGVGLAAMWPMVRLSQASPARPLRAGALDLLAVAGVMQAALWPIELLARWTWTVHAAMAGLLTAWAAIIGALLTLALRSPSTARAWWMLGCLALAGGAPALGLALLALGLAPGVSEAWLLASPVTAALSITRGPPGLQPVMDAADWWAVALPALAAGCLWAFLMVSSRRR